MKFMKKLTALSVACLMGLTLTGCGGNGSTDDTITVYSRDASSGTREAFEKANDMEEMLLDGAVTVDSNGDMATKVGQDANSFGYVSLSTDFAVLLRWSKRRCLARMPTGAGYSVRWGIPVLRLILRRSVCALPHRSV